MSNNLFDKLETPSEFNKFVLQAIIFTICASIPALILDIKIEKLRKSNPNNRIQLDIIQFVFGIMILYFYFKMYTKFSDTIQANIPGLYFSTFFFSLQSNLFADILAYANQLL